MKTAAVPKHRKQPVQAHLSHTAHPPDCSDPVQATGGELEWADDLPPSPDEAEERLFGAGITSKPACHCSAQWNTVCRVRREVEHLPPPSLDPGVGKESSAREHHVATGINQLHSAHILPKFFHRQFVSGLFETYVAPQHSAYAGST